MCDVMRCNIVGCITCASSFTLPSSADELAHVLAAFMDDKNLYLLLEYIIGGEFFSHLRKV
jgi:hypothetical protein